MLSDNLKMPLLRLTTYSSKTNHAVSHLKMIFDSKKNSQVEAELSTIVERTELSDIQSESIAGLFSQIIEEITNSFKDLPLEKIIFEADLNLLGLDNRTLKITCCFNPSKLEDDTDFFSQLLDKAEQYEVSQTIEHAVSNLVLHLNRSHLKSVDLIMDNSIPNESFFQFPFSSCIANKLNEIVESYEANSMNIAPATTLNFALTQRRRLQFLTGNTECRAKLIKDKDNFDLNSVQDVLAQLNIALNLADTGHICGIQLKTHGRGEYTAVFDLVTKQTSLESAGTIDLNHEKAKIYQYIFRMMLENYSYPQFAKDWIQSMKCTVKLLNDRFLLDFDSYHLVKIFGEQSIDSIQNDLHHKAVQFADKAQIKEINLTTKDDKVLKVDLSIDALNKRKQTIKGMHLTDLDADDPKAVITRTFCLTDSGYVFKKERFVD